MGSSEVRFADPLTGQLAGFVRDIGLAVGPGAVDDGAFLPGLALRDGGIVIDEARLRYPGDILHEAGHLAVVPAAARAQTGGRLEVDGGQEMGAIAWSWAAAVHLGIDPAVVFHPHGYKQGANALLENFAQGRYVGVPYLQWLGLAFEPAQAAREACPPYPFMVRWLCA
ncbi:MAG: hypothetical protein EOO25_21255 [Comamonadaceae bacterium]|nr:MAG: hypothetical protein EOO25_21255 [Comamonadaceae bacterium]